MVQDTASRKLDQYIVRFPDGMRDQLKAAAERNKRSMNAEIIARLEKSFSINQEVAHRWEQAPGEAPLYNLEDPAVLRAIETTVRDTMADVLNTRNAEPQKDNQAVLQEFFQNELVRIETDVPDKERPVMKAQLVESVTRAAKMFDVTWAPPWGDVD